jgi:hypothetical protein
MYISGNAHEKVVIKEFRKNKAIKKKIEKVDESTYRVTDEKPLMLYLAYFLSDLNKRLIK